MSYPANTSLPLFTRAPLFGSGNAQCAYYGGATQTTYSGGSPFSATNFPALSSWTCEGVFAIQEDNLNVATVCGSSSSTFQIGHSAALQAQGIVRLTSGTTLTLTGTSVLNDGKDHHVALVCVGAATSSFALYVDGVREATGSGVYTPSGASGGIGGSPGFKGLISELRLSNVARYTGASFTRPTERFLNNAANTVCLHHLLTDGTDSAGAVDLPLMGTVTISTAGGIDTITYPAATPGSNSVTGYQLWEATSTGQEALIASNSGSGGSTFTRPTAATNGIKTYQVYAVDSAANLSDPSNRVKSGFSSQARAYTNSNNGTPTYIAGPTGFGSVMHLVSGQSVRLYGGVDGASNTAGPFGARSLPCGKSWTIEMRLKKSGAGAIAHALGNFGHLLGVDASGNATYKYQIGSLGASITLNTTTVITDNVWRHVEVSSQAGNGPMSLSTLRFFIAGVLVGTGTYLYVPVATGLPQLGFGSAYWIGDIDEFAVSDVAQHTSAFTPPTAPYSKGRSGMIAYYPMEGSAADVCGLLDPPATPVVTIASAAGTDTISFSAVSAGTYPIDHYNIYAGTSSGGEASTPYASSATSPLTHPTATPGSTYYYYVRVVDSMGNVSLPSNEVFPAGSGLVITADNPCFLAPYEVIRSGAGASARLTSYHTGEKHEFIFIGQRCAMQFDLSALNKEVTICVRIDGQPWQQYLVGASLTIASGLALREHYVEWYEQWPVTAGDRYVTPTSGTAFKGVIIDDTGSVKSPAAKTIAGFFGGDSTTQADQTGYLNLPDGWIPTVGDTGRGYAWKVGEMLGALTSIVGVSGSAYTKNVGSFPAWSTAWQYVQNGVIRDWTQYRFAVFTLGQNDCNVAPFSTQAQVQAAAETMYGGILSAASANFDLFVAWPFAQTANPGNAKVNAAVTAAVAAIGISKLHMIDTTGFFDDTNFNGSPDKIHPYQSQAQAVIAPRYVDIIKPVIYPTGILSNAANPPPILF